MKTKKHRHDSLPETWHSNDENIDKCLPKIKHTPTPWKVWRYDNEIEIMSAEDLRISALWVSGIGKEARANADLIVRAVNSYEALLEAARCAGDALVDGQHKDIAINLLRQAIAQAEGGTL